MKQKILLLNPPSIKFNYSRDYFCSKVSKSNYVEHPIDLLLLSGILSADHKVEVLDATMLRLKPCACLKEILLNAPDYIIFITGTASWSQDSKFIKQVKKNDKHIKVVGIGNILLDAHVIMQNDWLDAVLFDFSTDDILKYIEGRYDTVKNMIFRNHGNIVYADRIIDRGQEFDIPLPRHELFYNKRYTFPFAKSLPFATVLTDYGCPFHCPFCVYSMLGSKKRRLEGIYAELEYIHKMDIRELFIKDQTFGYNKESAIQLCKMITEKRWDFSWTAFSRADVIDHELIVAMKKAGCHTLIVGVETANEGLLKKYKKDLTKDMIESAFRLCRKINIRTVGTFIIGFPDESRDSILETINFAIHLQCDFASFNVFVAKMKGPLEEQDGVNNEEIWNTRQADQSGIGSIRGNGVISGKEIACLRDIAVIRFYLRPLYIVKRIFKVSSLIEMRMFVENAYGLMRNFFNAER